VEKPRYLGSLATGKFSDSMGNCNLGVPNALFGYREVGAFSTSAGKRKKLLGKCLITILQGIELATCNNLCSPRFFVPSKCF